MKNSNIHNQHGQEEEEKKKEEGEDSEEEDDDGEEVDGMVTSSTSSSSSSSSPYPYLCICGGRHSVHSMKEGSIVLDLSLMQRIVVNVHGRQVVVAQGPPSPHQQQQEEEDLPPPHQSFPPPNDNNRNVLSSPHKHKDSTVTVEGGVKIGTLLEALEPYGLAPITGTHTSVGVIGLTLAGGLGFLSKRYGPAIDHIVSADIVLADGSIRTIDTIDAAAAAGPPATARDKKKKSTDHGDDDDNGDDDIWFNLRGVGGNIGVVTSLTMRVYPIRNVATLKCEYHVPRIGTPASTHRHDDDESESGTERLLLDFGRWSKQQNQHHRGHNNAVAVPSSQSCPDTCMGVAVLPIDSDRVILKAVSSLFVSFSAAVCFCRGLFCVLVQIKEPLIQNNFFLRMVFSSFSAMYLFFPKISCDTNAIPQTKVSIDVSKRIGTSRRNSKKNDKDLASKASSIPGFQGLLDLDMQQQRRQDDASATEGWHWRWPSLWWRGLIRGNHRPSVVHRRGCRHHRVSTEFSITSFRDSLEETSQDQPSHYYYTNMFLHDITPEIGKSLDNTYIVATASTTLSFLSVLPPFLTILIPGSTKRNEKQPQFLPISTEVRCRRA